MGARTEPQGKQTFNVVSFGAVADSTTMNTKAIQSAIDACANAGGGIVTFDPGCYLTGSLYLKEGVHLHIPEGVTLLGSQQIEDYPDIPTRVAGIEMVWPSALINVIGEKNVMISGKGEIDGQGGLRFKSAMNRGGTTEHIYLKDIVMEEVGTAIEATMNWNPSYSYSALPEEFKGKELPPHWVKMLETVDPPELGIPRFNNIHFSGITVHKARRALSVEGSEQSKMEHFSLNDITINAEHAGSVKHAEYWRMERIDIRSEDNLPVQVTESKDVSFPEESNVYLFSYFTGNGEDGLHLAYSFNSLSWKPLNNGESLLKPMVGKNRLMRD